MTSATVQVPGGEDGRLPGAKQHLPLACSFCRKRLGGEYFFTCLRCGGSYCYIHMSRHQPAPCARQEGRRRRAESQPLVAGISSLNV